MVLLSRCSNGCRRKKRVNKMDYYEWAYENLMKEKKSLDRNIFVDALLYQLEMDEEIEKSDPSVISWYQKAIAAKSL